MIIDDNQHIVFVPIWEKVVLSLNEAVAFSGIGRDKLKAISNSEKCSFVIWNGNKRMFKRKELEEYLVKRYSI